MPEYRVREVRIEDFKDEVFFYPEVLFHQVREVRGWYGWKGFPNWRASFYQQEKYTEWRMAFRTGKDNYTYSYRTQDAAQKMDADEMEKVVMFKDLESANSWISQEEREFSEWKSAKEKKLLNLAALIKAGNDLGVCEKIYPRDSVVATSYSFPAKLESVATEVSEVGYGANDKSVTSIAYPYYDFSTPPADGDNVIFRDISSDNASDVYMVTFHPDQWDSDVLKTLRWCKIPEYKKDDSGGDKKDLVL